MGNKTSYSALTTFAALIVALSSHARLSVAFDANSGSRKQILIPTQQAVRLYSLGFDRLLADYFWLSLIGYLGESSKRRFDHYELTDRYIELITGLDPHFLDAYWFGTFVIGGDQRNPRRAAEILDNGIESNPESWSLPFIAGINQYLYAGNEVAAAKYYRIAANYPDAPAWLLRQAEILEAKLPRLIKEASSWLNIFESAGNGAVKDLAQERAIRLWVQVYKTAPNDAYRNRAREVLKELGVDVGSLKKPE